MLKIYNTLTKQKEAFTPLKPKKIGIYVCGLTVYDDCHIGHARLFVCYDIIVRYLRSTGYDVDYVRNITDIDDKIIRRAKELKIDYQELTKKIITSELEDEKALNISAPNFTPRVTEHIPQILEMIQNLIDKGYAYQATNGDVYFDITKFAGYGKLYKRARALKISS